MIVRGFFMESNQKQVFKDITPQEANEIIKMNDGNAQFVLMDVRTQVEFQGAHLEGAKLVDYQSSEFAGEIAKMDKDKKYLLYCRSGVRSANAMQIMRMEGFKEVYNMLGGIGRWSGEGLPLVK